MRTHWTAFGVGALLGLIVSLVYSRGMGGNPAGITGGFARPFQPGVSYPR